MSRDIRSFFTVLAKKSGDALKAQKPKKPVVISDSDNDDIVEASPERVRNPKVKRRAVVLGSDSEDEGKSKHKSAAKKYKSADKPKKDEKSNLKPIDLDSLNEPIKQSEVIILPKEQIVKPINEVTNRKTSKRKSKKGKNPEIEIHGDRDFEKTLEDLDEESDDTILLDNMDLFDKTIEEAGLLEQTKDAKDSSRQQRKDTETNGRKKQDIDMANHKDKATPTKIKSTPKKAEKRQRNNSESTPTPKKKLKLEQTDSGIDPDLEKLEKRRQSASLYMAYLHRKGPKHHGEKEYPKGNPNCLRGLTFMRTGVLDSLHGEEFQNLVTDHEGKVVHSVSKKVNYVVVGDEPGPAKLEKARKYNLPQISEDEFLDLILVKSGMKPRYSEKAEYEDMGIGGSENGSPKSIEKSPQSIKCNKAEYFDDSELIVNKPAEELEKLVDSCDKLDKSQHKPIKEELKEEPKTYEKSLNNSESLSWTDKYKPTNIKGIIGQQDGNSNMNKLRKWMENWFKHFDPVRGKKLPKSTQYNQFDGSHFKAALLSGSPGVGKTTTATLVAKELGFDIVEFNASDTRNKKLLHEEISHMMGSKTVAGFASGHKNINQKRVLLMDEVDGMAGNEDRGGIAELIALIKTANFPIVCMCNNRDLQKMRSLTNHCYALKFSKPNVTQVKGAMMSICFKEGLTIKPDTLAQLITGTGCDIRQTLNHLSMWSAAEKNLSAETVQKESKNSQKDVVVGPWDVIRKVFSKNENRDMTLADKSRLFFYDYSFGPLFVQENYLTTTPDCTGPKEKWGLERLIRTHLTADCLSRSDLVESKIRSTNNWSLLESQAFLCTVLPSHYMSGRMEMVRFPGWFGKNSHRNKSLRMIGELYSHARTSLSGDKFSVRLDYAEPLMKRLVGPLVKKQIAGVDDTLEVMKSYSLLRDDLTNVCELIISKGDGRNPELFDSVSSQVKSALTRKYNKTIGLKFAPPTASKRKKGAVGDPEDHVGDEEEYSEEEETEDNIKTDALIKVKNKSSAKAAGSKAAGASKQSKPKGKTATTSSAKGKAKK